MVVAASLPDIPCRLEAQLPSFTVKWPSDWRGQLSNGAALPLIFCLSLGVRLIYHASSPADIQIHFDWQLDSVTARTTGAASVTLASAHALCHAVKFDAFQSERPHIPRG